MLKQGMLLDLSWDHSAYLYEIVILDVLGISFSSDSTSEPSIEDEEAEES